jgi:hypothetical protein
LTQVYRPVTDVTGRETFVAQSKRLDSMPNPFSHPSSEKLLGDIKTLFETNRFYQKKDRHLIFLCGGSVSPYSRSLRKKFIRYSQKHLPKFRVILAETVVKDISEYSDPYFFNIADFETFITDISDCLLIFPESPGSIAEIGFFSNNEETVKKILAVTDLHRQHDSFIYIGPIDKIYSKSIFKSVVIDYKKPNFEPIKKRLNDRLRTSKGKRFSFKNFLEYTIQERLYLVFQLLIIFSALSLEGLVDCVNKIFGTYKLEEIKHFLSFLVATEYVRRIGDDGHYFVPVKSVEGFLEVRKGNIEDIKMKALSFYQSHHNETIEIIKEAKKC